MDSFHKGWARKFSGKIAVYLARTTRSKFMLFEDGFIRSIGLGDSQLFSKVEDDIGIYYDATGPSKLENLLNNYDFKNDSEILKIADSAIELIKQHQISKYNHAPIINDDYFAGSKNNKVLIIAQTKGDLSHKYGLADQFDTNDIIDFAIKENPNAEIYLKLHPDVINDNKKSDVNIDAIKYKCKIITNDVNSISLLKYFNKVYTKTSQMGFEGLMMGCKCVCFGMPFYAGWGLTDDRVSCSRRKRNLSLEEVFAASYILYPKYHNPIKQKPSYIIDTIEKIARYRDLRYNLDSCAYVIGFSNWKKKFIKSYLSKFKKENIHYINSSFLSNYQAAKKLVFASYSELFLWGNQNKEIEEISHKKNWKLSRIEDGFIRSSGLGADLIEPISLIFDNIGIYFDSTRPSLLEEIIKSQLLAPEEIERARILREKIVNYNLTKYNVDSKKCSIGSINKKVILVVGQVEEDASIQYGSPKVKTNLDLIKIVRNENQDAHIIYKPHPDIIAKLRKQITKNQYLKKYCDEIIHNVSVSSLYAKIDELHTMTSLMGFEALLRGTKVVCYGMPFYAGWGLTEDKLKCERRDRKIVLDELVFASLITYSKYMHPIRKMFITPEEAIDFLLEEREKRPKKKNIYRKFMRFIMAIINNIKRK